MTTEDFVEIEIEHPGTKIVTTPHEEDAFVLAVRSARKHKMVYVVYQHPEESLFAVLNQGAINQYVAEHFKDWLGRGQVFG